MANFNLTGSFENNINPWDIEPVGSDPTFYESKDRTARRWNFFQTWLQTIGNTYNPVPPQNVKLKPFEPIVGNPVLNTQAEGKPITDWLITLYNSLNTTPDVYKINDIDINKIQVFTAKANPLNTIKIDNWIGSQTSRMKYPLLNTSYTAKSFSPRDVRPLNSSGYIGLIWGNKRIAVDAKALNIAVEKANGDKSPYRKPGFPPFGTPGNFILYEDPQTFQNIYGNTLQTDTLPKTWNILGQSTTINQSPTQINRQTTQQQQQNQQQQQRTNLINNI